MFSKGHRRIAAVCALLTTSACTTVGIHRPDTRAKIDFGEPQRLRVCALTDTGVEASEVHRLIDAVNEEFSRYGLQFDIARIEPWQRTSFFGEGIYREIGSMTLEPPCDRQVAFVGRHFGDFLFGLLAPEMLGGVDLATHTRGFIVARRASLNQLLLSPSAVAVHEFYHLVGCGHSSALTDCYQTIRKLKALADQNRRNGNDFFPGISERGIPMMTRKQADTHAMLAISAADNQATARRDY